jgi:hypothetical protein
MVTPTTARPVLPARGAPISDGVLESVIAAARQIEHGPELTDEAAALICLCTRPLLEELLNWRRKAGVIRELVIPDNVVVLPGART